ncbi:MAG: hypothetical protein LBI39_00670 [Puniceicoccales bacterium]|nr:hypothetical protein [Puniceicoccales bacterium]
MRIDLFLARNFPNRSRRTIQSAISAGTVFIGDRRAESDFSVRDGEVLRIGWQEQKCGGNFRETKRREGDLRILYEDDHAIVVHKRAGEVVHPAENFYGPSTVSAAHGESAKLGEKRVDGRQKVSNKFIQWSATQPIGK